MMLDTTILRFTTAIDGDGREPIDQTLYILRFWLPVIGPTATLLRWVALDALEGHALNDNTASVTMTAGELCERTGVGFANVVENALQRGHKHGYWTHTAGTWHIPARVPIVPPRHVRRRGVQFSAAHDAWIAALAR